MRLGDPRKRYDKLILWKTKEATHRGATQGFRRLDVARIIRAHKIAQRQDELFDFYWKISIRSLSMEWINGPSGRRRPLSDPSTTTPQVKTRFVCHLLDEEPSLLWPKFLGLSPVDRGTILRGEELKAI